MAPETPAGDAAGQAPAAHALVKIAEDLARYLRLVSGGTLSLAVVPGERGQPIGWDDAYLAAAAAAGETTDAEVRATAAEILRGSLARAEWELTATAPPAPPPDPAAGRAYFPELGDRSRCVLCGLPAYRSDVAGPGSVTHVRGGPDHPATALLNAHPHNAVLPEAARRAAG